MLTVHKNSSCIAQPVKDTVDSNSFWSSKDDSYNVSRVTKAPEKNVKTKGFIQGFKPVSFGT